MAGPFRPGTRDAPRTFLQTLRRASVPPTIAFAAAASWMTGHAVAPSVPGLADLSVASPPASAALPLDQPSWGAADASAFPGCHARPVGGSGHAGTVVVVTQGAERRSMSWTQAWDLTHDHNYANDVWVIGDCP